VEGLLAERGVEVDPRDHLPVGPALHAAAGRGRTAVPTTRERPLVDRETYVKVGGQWRYVHRAIDQHGQIIDVYVTAKPDRAAARKLLPPGADHRGSDAAATTT